MQVSGNVSPVGYSFQNDPKIRQMEGQIDSDCFQQTEEPVVAPGRNSLENSTDSISSENEEEIFQGTFFVPQHTPFRFVGAPSLVSEDKSFFHVSVSCRQLFGLDHIAAEEVKKAALSGKAIVIQKADRIFQLTFKQGIGYSPQEIDDLSKTSPEKTTMIDPSESEDIEWFNKAVYFRA